MASQISVLMIAPPGRLRDGLHVLLHASGLQVTIRQVDNGVDALPLIAQTPPQIILLDVGLTGDPMWPMLQQIRTDWPAIRSCVLVHTADQAQRAWESGADAVLPAGFAAETLFKVLRELNEDYGGKK